MKPPTIKLTERYSIKYIQVLHDDRYYIILNEGIESCRIKSCEAGLLMDLIYGIASKLDTPESRDIYRRLEKFMQRVRSKDEILEKKLI